MGSRLLDGNDEYAGPAEPGRDGFPLSRERRLGCRGWVPVLSRERRLGGRGWVPVFTGTTSMRAQQSRGGMGSRCHGSDGWVAGDGFPFARERRLGGRGWVPVFTGTTSMRAQQSRGGMGSRCHGNDGWGAGDGFPSCTGTTSMRAQQSRGGMGSRLHGNDGWGAGDGFPLSRERRLGGRGWVPVFTGTTVGLPRMGSRCHGNDGRGGGNDGGGAGAGLGVWYTLGCGMGVPVCGFLGMYEVVRTAGWGLFRRGRCACRRSARGGGARG